MRKTLSLLGALVLLAATAQAQQPTAPATPKATTANAATSKGDSALTNRGDAQPMDINTASRSQLIDAGWGQYADGIIASRPYTNMDQLSEKNIVPRTAFDEGSAKFNLGSQDGADSPLRNQSVPAAGTSGSTNMSGMPQDSTRAATAVPGSTSPARDSTTAPSP